MLFFPFTFFCSLSLVILLHRLPKEPSNFIKEENTHTHTHTKRIELNTTTMVFSSIPSYLDPPNWQQQPNHQHQGNGSESSPQFFPVPPPHGAGSTVDQAQLAKIQAATPDQAAAALKCPRCESTNTKFCYFNNYSLSQPRHFCKTCRRYWTRGGALRNVPVGGGCRRNHRKNKKSSTSNTTTTRSKSPISNNDKEKEYSPVPLSGVIATSCTTPHDEQIGQFLNHRPYMMTNSLQNLSLGLNNLREIQAQTTTGHMGFQFGGGGGVDQWRFQQFPNFFNGFDQSSTTPASVVSYPFQSDVVEAPSAGLVGGDVAAANSSRVAALTHQLPSVKFEYNGGLNLLPRSPLSFSENNNNHYNSWTTHDLSALASSSAAAHHLL